MKTEEAQKPNGVVEDAKMDKIPETQDIVLTDKQKQMLKEISAEKNQLQMLADTLAKREVMLSTLIMDSAGIDDEQVASAQLSPEGDVLIVTKK